MISSLLMSAIEQREIPTISFTSISAQTCCAGHLGIHGLFMMTYRWQVMQTLHMLCWPSGIHRLFMMTYLCTDDRWWRLCTCCVGCSGVHGLFMVTYLCTGDRWWRLHGLCWLFSVHGLFMVTYLCTGDMWCRLHGLCWLLRCMWIVHGDLPVYRWQMMETAHVVLAIQVYMNCSWWFTHVDDLPVYRWQVMHDDLPLHWWQVMHDLPLYRWQVMQTLHRLCWPFRCMFRCIWIIHDDLPVYRWQVTQTLHRLCWPFRCTWTTTCCSSKHWTTSSTCSVTPPSPTTARH